MFIAREPAEIIYLREEERQEEQQAIRATLSLTRMLMNSGVRGKTMRDRATAPPVSMLHISVATLTG